MKFFKKPSVALVSAILVVYISTMASVCRWLSPVLSSWFSTSFSCWMKSS